MTIPDPVWDQLDAQFVRRTAELEQLADAITERARAAGERDRLEKMEAIRRQLRSW
ncbi:hypothetical protein HY632_03185 [Candidatus Uhrbacteria bacterium]|nr:hypothetical protein [Candidatus Uhrbacteria bacterium]